MTEESSEKTTGDEREGERDGNPEPEVSPSLPDSQSPQSLVLAPAAGTATRPESASGLNGDYVCSTRFESAEGPVFLWAVADGSGDHGAGQWASEQAVITLREAVGYRVKEDPENALAPDSIRDLFLTIHDFIGNESKAQNLEAEVSLTACIRRGQAMILAHSGANRAYGITAGKIIRLTPLMGPETGALPPETAEINPVQPESGEIPKAYSGALGGASAPAVDVQIIDPGEADILVLITGSVADMISNPELRETIVMAASPQNACNRIMSLLDIRGLKNDASVVVVGFTSLHGIEIPARPRKFFLRPLAAAVSLLLIIAIVIMAAFWPRFVKHPESGETLSHLGEVNIGPGSDNTQVTVKPAAPGRQNPPAPKKLVIQSPWPMARILIDGDPRGMTDQKGAAELTMDPAGPWEVIIAKNGKTLGDELIFPTQDPVIKALFSNAAPAAVSELPEAGRNPKPAAAKPPESSAELGAIRIYTDLPFASVRLNGALRGLTDELGTFHINNLPAGNYVVEVGDESFAQNKFVSLTQGGIVGARFYFGQRTAGEPVQTVENPRPAQGGESSQLPPPAPLPDPIMIRFETRQSAVDVKFYSGDALAAAGSSIHPERFRILKPGVYRFVAQKLKFKSEEFDIEIHDGINIIAFEMQPEGSAP